MIKLIYLSCCRLIYLSQLICRTNLNKREKYLFGVVDLHMTIRIRMYTVIIKNDSRSRHFTTFSSNVIMLKIYTLCSIATTFVFLCRAIENKTSPNLRVFLTSRFQYIYYFHSSNILFCLVFGYY